MSERIGNHPMRLVLALGEDAGMTRSNLYLVERYWPGVTAEVAVDAAATLDAATALADDANRRVRHLRSGLVPADEVVWSMLEADSEAAVIAVTTLARYPVDRISQTIVVGGSRR